MVEEAKSFTDEAREAYFVWRGSLRLEGKPAPPHWDVLDADMRDALTTVYFLGRLDRQEAR